METMTSSPGWFAPKLATALAETQTSVRELARRMNGGDPESSRRSIHRYLAGRVPNPETRRRIAELLGVDPRELEPDGDDDSEDDLVARLNRHAREARDIARILARHARVPA